MDLLLKDSNDGTKRIYWEMGQRAGKPPQRRFSSAAAICLVGEGDPEKSLRRRLYFRGCQNGVSCLCPLKGQGKGRGSNGIRKTALLLEVNDIF